MTKPEIMTLEEVAEYLRVSERTVYDWAQKGEIPCGKLGTAWRFKRIEIEAWVDRQLTAENSNSKDKPFFLQGLLSSESIIFPEVTTKSGVLTLLIDILSKSKAVKNRNELTEKIFYREQLMSTGIGLGVAVPHVRLSSIKDIAVAVAVVPGGILDYESMDGEPVKLVFMIAARKDQHVEHLQTLAAINTKLKDKKFKEELIAAPTPTDFYNKLIK